MTHGDGLLAVIAFVLALSATAAAAQDETGSQLEEVERSLEQDRLRQRQLQLETAELEKELVELRHQLVSVAGKVQDHEAEVSRIEARLEELVRAETDKSARLDLSNDQVADVLVALLKLGRRPPEALIVQSMTPPDMVRSAILLRTAVPHIEDRSRALRKDLVELVAARRATAERRRQLEAATANLDNERVRMEWLVKRTDELRKRAVAEGAATASRVEALAGRAKDLRDLMEALESENRRQRTRAAEVALETRVPFSKARGRMLFPAIGPVIALYGESTETGFTRKGVTIETRAGAQVIAPYGGKVVFAGPFRGYGQLLIIEHGEGYHSLLAGLARLDNSIGQQVLAGEPVGVMGQPDNKKPALYLELRRNSQPINPLPWLVARKS